MKLSLFHILIRSLFYYRTPSFYQFLIILFLSAIITGSLLTGVSVRSSLLNSNEHRLYGTGIVVSSGTRYFPLSLTKRMEEETGERCTGLLELKGWVRNFNTGESALNIQVLGVNNRFFDSGNTSDVYQINKGEVVINKQVANRLNLSSGDDIILRVGNISNIPSSSPFAPEGDAFESFVLTVKYIIDQDGPADFSLGISQVRPLNVFVSLSEFEEFFPGEPRINRMLIKNSKTLSVESIRNALLDLFMPGDAGMSFRIVQATNQLEIISDRVFIGSTELEEISGAIPEARPVITYLVNRLSLGDRSTPYSFVSALPDELYNFIPDNNGIVINRWLADDLDANIGDTISLTYYSIGDYKKLIEEEFSFIVSKIVEMVSIWSDHTLMPEFPGISGSESCSSWDAGVPVDLDEIREKDEEWWNDFKGTPKAFINYKIGNELWGSDFGPATAIRFPGNVNKDEALNRLKGEIDPLKTGFSIINVREDAIAAAKNSVDFSTLFLSLSFFIILSSLVLLTLVVSTQFESRKGQVSAFRALGLSNRVINKMLFFESGIIAFLGSISGMFAGNLFNNLIIRLLNSVWAGAVQTSTLKSYFDINSMILGMIITFLLVLVVLRINLRNQLKLHGIKQKENIPDPGKNIIWLFYLSAIFTILQILIAIFKPEIATILWFTGGATLFVSFLLFYRLIISLSFKRQSIKPGIRRDPSWLYYAYYPSRAITPVLFLATGLFIVIITGANRKSFNRDNISRASGTGGYILWGETVTPLMYDLNSAEGKNEYDISGEEYSGLYFIQAKRADGDDASCLNLNQVKSPPLLGMDISHFSNNGSFSFATVMKGLEVTNPWDALYLRPADKTIYGIIDQTVLQWNLYRKVGDTLVLSTESGETVNIIIAAGLESSVFQGHILIGINNFNHFYPSISGSNLFLVDGKTDNIVEYKESLSEKLSAFGTEVSYTNEKLASFNEVSNTYLTVFMTLGGFGLIMGVAGLGFVLLRNFNLRRKEYAIMLASGFSPSEIRASIRKEHFFILIAGVIAGAIPALVATLPSLLSDAHIPVGSLLLITGLIFVIGSLTIFLSVRKLVNSQLIISLKKE